MLTGGNALYTALFAEAGKLLLMQMKGMKVSDMD